jgi:exoribonuclease R
MMDYICNINKRDYSEYTYTPSLEGLDNPHEYHLFNEDVFTYNDGNVIIKNSTIRNNKNIPGILLLEGNKTFGRNKKKLFYKCKPHDSKLPFFLIPYEMPMGFNKNFKNKYVTFYFASWEERHPYGIISQNIGDVYNLPSFYEYQLYCKHLHDSISQSISHTKKLLKNNTVQYYENIILNSPNEYGSYNKYDNEYIFSIDPEGCLDKDDAISIKKNNNDIVINVYIANVWVWLNVLELWDLIGSRISTIYFPDFKRPMLPTTVGETLCSLEKNTNKFVFVMEFHFSIVNGTILENTEKNTLKQGFVKISENYSYEEKRLLKNKSYKELIKLTKQLDNIVNDSHDVVEYWMLKMNERLAFLMRKKNIGIYRVVKSHNKNIEVNESYPFIIKVLEQQISGKYLEISQNEDNIEHEILGYSQYIHFTSPIRRMPDLLNQLSWVYNIISPSNINSKAVLFYKKQVSELDVLNNKMKKIRRIQNDCHILSTVFNEMSILDRVYDGIIVSIDNDKLNIYIEDLQWLTTCINENTSLNKYDKIKCSLFLFEKEDQMRRKIRVKIQ